MTTNSPRQFGKIPIILQSALTEILSKGSSSRPFIADIFSNKSFSSKEVTYLYMGEPVLYNSGANNNIITSYKNQLDQMKSEKAEWTYEIRTTVNDVGLEESNEICIFKNSDLTLPIGILRFQ